ncbi:MAG: 30S ribosomal protein S17 [Candidatus Thermoplasmatota archaeon]|nr:30S ribosomal protein S17 [Candidatus Thermoplasmatota archaeon]
MPVKKKVVKKSPEGRNIGLGIETPKDACKDQNCPFHGNLPIRGFMFEGTVVTDRMDKTVIVKRERTLYNKKYERYEKRTSRIPAHSPPCVGAKKGDMVAVAECRPLSKTVAYVVVQKR